MNIIRIAIRLADAKPRALRPFRIALRLASARAVGAVAPFFSHCALRWSKRLKRLSDPVQSVNRHMNLSLHIMERIEMRLADRLVVFVKGLPDKVVMQSVVLPASSSLKVWPYRICAHGTMANARGSFKPLTAATKLFCKRVITESPPGIPLPWRNHRCAGRSDTAFAKVTPKPRFGLLAPVLLDKCEGFRAKSWQRRLARKARDVIGSTVSPRYETVINHLDLWPAMREAPARLAGVKDIGSETRGLGFTTAADGQSAKPTALAYLAADPLRLLWRETAPKVETDAFSASGERRISTSGDHGNTPAALDRFEQANEKIIAKACEAARHEVLSKSNIEHLIGDVMRRLDNRMRIERERRGL